MSENGRKGGGRSAARLSAYGFTPHPNFELQTLSGDYCWACARPTQTAPAAGLGYRAGATDAIEAAEAWRKVTFLVTAVEPFLLRLFGENSCGVRCGRRRSRVSSTNGMRFAGQSLRNAALVAARRASPLQIKPRQFDGPEAHERPSWKGSWANVLEGNRAGPRRKIPGTIGGKPFVN